MNTITEYHTTDLTAECMRSVSLRWQGQIEPEMTTAMARGALFDAMACLLHQGHKPVESTIGLALATVASQSKEERRPWSKAVTENCAALCVDVFRMGQWYAERIMPTLGNTIATQVPVRVTIDVDGEPAEFASHLDLFTRKDGRLVVADWKVKEESPTLDYLSRNLQMALYWYAVRHGHVLIDELVGWQQMGEWPLMAYIDAERLKPYSRKGTHTEDGETVEHAAGEHRPIQRIVHYIDFKPECAARVEEELRTRVRMFRRDLFPTNPAPVRCHVCQSKRFCPWFIGGEK